MSVIRYLPIGGILVLLAACAGPAATFTPAPTATPTSAPTTAPTAAPTPVPTEAPTATPDACAAANLAVKNAGRITVGTDNPAFPPYFLARDGGNTEPWDPEWGDPTTGKGFESAVAYAVAQQLGFDPAHVDWVVVPWTTSFAPGDKTWDFDLNETAYTTERAQAVDFSDPYYYGNQTVIVAADGPFAGAATIADLKAARLGAVVASTSYAAIENVIKPAPPISVYDTNDLAIQALTEVDPPQIDGIVVDLPTAFFIVNVQTEGLKIVGQLGPETGAQPEQWGLLLQKDSALTPCINVAMAALTADGTLAALVDTWLEDKDVPQIQP